MDFDFSKLGSSRTNKLPIDPIEIFENLPSLSNTPNDLWRGQYKALQGWKEHRDKNDVLISLNTGAGKTIVGLLIAQSLVNEGKENVVYVCSTIDLVRQTAREAERLGIPYTERVRREFSNNAFERGKAFCITTYAALLNGHSKIRKSFPPKAIIFDDAHVAEDVLRDSFTLRVESREYSEIFRDIVELFRPAFRELEMESKFDESVSYEYPTTSFVPPRHVIECENRLKGIFEHYNIKEDKILTYPYTHLRDKLKYCAAIFRRGIFEISPPFLPSLALDIFGCRIQRIYLSATLKSKVNFIRAFGRLPKATVVPDNDAGNGERLILAGETIKGGFDQKFVGDLSKRHKSIVAVPNYSSAEKWKSLAILPERKEFSEKLDEFRRAETGIFILVSRLDGIDLPDNTCRVMVVEGLPIGSSLLEKYQWEYLNMDNVQSVRIANRLTQLFGRINRGRNDYGAFLLEGEELENWLGNDRNLSLLPELLQKQVSIGRKVQEGFGLNKYDTIQEFIGKVFDRDKGWMDYYGQEINASVLDKKQVVQGEMAESAMEKAALAESQYAKLMWTREADKARIVIEDNIGEIKNYDALLAGWHNIWLGAAYDIENDKESAERAYAQAMRRLGNSMVLPRKKASENSAEERFCNPFAQSFSECLLDSQKSKVNKEIARIEEDLGSFEIGTPHQAEAAVRFLGEILGFKSTRPDNDYGTGPDVVWADERCCIAFELKTDKKDDGGTYHKKEINQGLGHLQWMNRNDNFSEHQILGLVFVGPDGSVDSHASPSDDMFLCCKDEMKALMGEIVALLKDLKNRTPLDRSAAIKSECGQDKWRLESLFKRLAGRRISECRQD